MKTNKNTLDALRLELDLEAIARREGVLLADIIELAGEEPDKFVRDWITKHYFELGEG